MQDNTSNNGTNGGAVNNNTGSSFRRLFLIDVSSHIEKKGQFSYLSWPFAVAQLRLADPQAFWKVERFNGLPYLHTELGVFVEVAVTVDGVCLSQIHPVLDSRNRPIMAPSSFDINTSIQRCLVKAIALHGLGLNIYAGEDLPMLEASGSELKAIADTTVTTPVTKATVTTLPAPEPRDPEPAQRGDTITLAQCRYITKLIAETGTELSKVLDYFGVARIEDIAKSEASRVIRSLEQARNRATGKEAA
jgi:hypothetical protein